MRFRNATITLSLGLVLFAVAGRAVDTKPIAQDSASRDNAKDKGCGPPNYCARTDRKVEPFPATPPKLGPAGSYVTDPNFGTRILRVTDSKTDYVREGGSLMSPSSAEQNSWNSNSTRFYVENSGGKFLLYDFDPTTMTAKPSHSLGTSWGAEPQFGYTNPNLMYGFGSRSTAFQQYDVSNDKVSILHDITSCLKLEGDDIGHSITVSADDNRMETGVGPKQGENYIVYIYDRQQGCRWYNTKTGEIGGKWGPKGTVTMPDRFTIHNIRMSKSGKYAYVARANSSQHHGWVVWEIETMNVVICPIECGGHRALGYSHLISPSGREHPMDTLIRPLNNLSDVKPLITGLSRTDGYWYDQHFSWNNANADDTTPICLTTYRPSNPNTPGTPLSVDGPWENEVLCVETDGKDSKVWRFAHTFSTAKNGFWSTPRGNISPDGRFFMFTSDWEDQLGETQNGKKFRTDVFVVELR
jgi:hypothetical protein